MKSNSKKLLEKYPDLDSCTIAIIGLGYVGLPLAVEFARENICNITGNKLSRKVIGFDINKSRLEELKKGFDKTNEISRETLLKINFHNLTDDYNSIAIADIFIVTVPTPINSDKIPDLKALKSASSTVGDALKIRYDKQKRINDKSIPIVIFESTVFPGSTEDICIPIIEKKLGLKNVDENNNHNFVFGYSPERINPGDKKHTLRNIKKITSGNNKKSAEWINRLYASIIDAGTYSTQSIKVAEAAKIIENTQRDLNIALINELAIIFKLMNIDTLDVIEAASTKWNFLNFKPGLVGGHCIGVDPYYLTYKAKVLGYSPEIVLAGRRINDQMGKWVAENVILEMVKRNLKFTKSKVLILGFTFKEDCSDTRNTRVIDIIKHLKEYKLKLEVVDPLVNKEDVHKIYKLELINKIPKKEYSVIVCAVAHRQFSEIKVAQWKSMLTNDGFIYDLKGIIPRELNPIRL